MSDGEGTADAQSETDGEGAVDGLRYEPDPDEEGVEPYEVFVQWERGQAHEHAETIDAPGDRMALMLAKRNIDVRQNPLSIWVVPRSAVTRSAAGDTTLRPSTDRSYRNIQWYAENAVEAPDDADAPSGGRARDA